MPGLCEGKKSIGSQSRRVHPGGNSLDRHKSSQILPTVAGTAVQLINHLQHI